MVTTILNKWKHCSILLSQFQFFIRDYANLIVIIMMCLRQIWPYMANLITLKQKDIVAIWFTNHCFCAVIYDNIYPSLPIWLRLKRSPSTSVCSLCPRCLFLQMKLTHFALIKVVFSFNYNPTADEVQLGFTYRSMRRGSKLAAWPNEWRGKYSSTCWQDSAEQS